MFHGVCGGAVLAAFMAMTLDRALGRWLAFVVHPRAAWLRLRPSDRALLVATYFGAGYVGALLLLLTIH